MRVTIVVDNAPARIERLTKIAQSLQSAGNEVTVVCPGSVPVLPLYSVRRIASLMTNSFTKYLSFMIGIFFALLAERRKIVHYVNHPDYAVPAVCAACLLGRHKLVYDRRVDFGGVVASRHPKLAFFARVIEEVGCRSASAITVDSPSRKQRLMKYARKLEVIPNGVSLGEFAVPRKKHTGFVVKCVAALTEVEGINIFVKAAFLARKRDKSILFEVVGDGELRSSLIRLSRSLGSPVKFLGWVPHNLIPEVLASSDICVSSVLPISYSRGSYPVKLFEYFASGTPTVVSDVPAHLELVTDRKHALVYHAYDPAELARKVIELKRNPRLRSRLSRNAILIARRFSWDESFRRLNSVYRQLDERGRFEASSR
ncbi:MAG: glycosyltransferase family 4 protein [Candidatus Bathyarchaeia archaeon]